MDDTSPAHIQALRQAAATLIAANGQALDTLCEQLTIEGRDAQS
jgi:hypothetical protein